MTKPNNSLLDEAIKESIDQARYQEPKKEKEKRSIFYLIVVFLVSFAVLLSLLRYL